jgi:hypothetical protein
MSKTATQTLTAPTALEVNLCAALKTYELNADHTLKHSPPSIFLTTHNPVTVL